jgi:hypothetical protein
MEILGRSEIRLPANTYSRALPEITRQAMEKMDAVLGREK